MSSDRVPNSHIERLINAFAQDRYTVDRRKIVDSQDRVGMLAEHREATNYNTGERKRAYYVEGTPRQMGYLLGRMAEPEIAKMTTTFIDSVLWDFVVGAVSVNEYNAAELEKARLARSLHDWLIDTVYEMSKNQHMFDDIPAEYQEEMRGIVEGCKEANKSTQVKWEDLWVLNVGVDCLLSMVYSGHRLRKRRVRPWELRIPIMCNGFAIFGDAAGGGHYFGRDFMFSNGGVFQDVACLIIYNPDASAEKPSLPFVSMTAPGIVGSIAAMNSYGVGAGVDMVPAANCDPDRPGLNSLLLVRQSIQYGNSADAAVDVMVKAQRGVSWDYIIADGSNDKACIVEAGYSTDRIPILDFPHPPLKKFLPDQAFLDAHPSGPIQNGLMVRWSDYKYPEVYMQFNQKLWERYRKTLYPDALGELGHINRTPTEENCPESYYFAPQRKTHDDIVLVTNHFISPEMRLCAMHPWTNSVAKSHLNDIQWRYDELNHQILAKLWEKKKQEQYINYEDAKCLINFLAEFPHYYARNPKSKDGEQFAIRGSVSLFDLKKKTIESHFGYYSDKWIKIKLKRYVR